MKIAPDSTHRTSVPVAQERKPTKVKLSKWREVGKGILRTRNESSPENLLSLGPYSTFSFCFQRFPIFLFSDCFSFPQSHSSLSTFYQVVVIKDGQLFVSWTPLFFSLFSPSLTLKISGLLQIRSTREAGDARISSLLHTLHKAITSTPTSDPLQKPLPPIELVFSTADRDGISANAKAGWAISKRLDDDWRNGIWLMPDFGFSA